MKRIDPESYCHEPIRSFGQIARLLRKRPAWRGITSEGVRWHHNNAIRKLRKKLEAK